MKPLFSNKVQSRFSISLLENSQVESTESKAADVYNKYFVNKAESLDIANIHEQESSHDHMDDASLAIVERCRTHPSILEIKLSVNNTINILEDHN